MAVMYYFGAETFLIDTQRADVSVPVAVIASLAFLAGGWLVYDLLCRSPIGKHTALLALSVFVLIVLVGWGLNQLFSDRAAFLHVGAVIGTIMSANVFFIIIPNQKKVVADLKAGRQPATELGQQAKQRSLHNNYLTLPVLLLMVGAHYPLLFAGQATWGWLVIALILLIGGVVRHFFNTWHTGARGSTLLWQWPLAALLGVVLVIFLSTRQTMPLTEPVSDERALALIQMHCVACHAATPSHSGFKSPPAGLTLDTRETVILAAERVMAQAVLSKAMPLGNATGMTDTERAELGGWLRQQRRP